MKIGIIAEGHSDRAVLHNILKGLLGIDGSDIIAVLPIDAVDETDLANIPREQFGGWSSVKRECEKKEFIDLFFERAGDNFLVIHLDTAESAEYGIIQPVKDEQYAEKLRNLVIHKINEWLGRDISSSLLYAIAVEEIDAWILTLLVNANSVKSADPKKKLEYTKGIPTGKLKPNFDLYLEYSKEFKISDGTKYLTYRSRNKSLDLFCDEVTIKALPLIQS